MIGVDQIAKARPKQIGLSGVGLAERWFHIASLLQEIG
jgi:hypothetical protein